MTPALVQAAAVLDLLTDAEADNLRVAVRQGDLPAGVDFTWAVVADSWQQMPHDVRAHYGDPQLIDAALEVMLAHYGQDGSVLDAYACSNLKGHTYLGEKAGQPCIYCGAPR